MTYMRITELATKFAMVVIGIITLVNLKDPSMWHVVFLLVCYSGIWYWIGELRRYDDNDHSRPLRDIPTRHVRHSDHNGR